MKAALKHAKEALATAERAFVFIDGFNFELSTAADDETRDFSHLRPFYQRNPGIWITRFAAQPKWRNGGNTPTTRLTVQCDWRLFREGIPPDFDYPYREQPAAFLLPPRAMEISPILIIPPAMALVEWENNPVGIQPIILIWGRADYRDVFDKSHFIQWCYWLRFSRPIPAERMGAQFIQWGPYNRTD